MKVRNIRTKRLVVRSATTAASGGGGDTVKLWDSQTGEQLLTLTGHTADVDGVAFSPSGDLLASASWDGTIKIWDATPLPERP